jgi:hypothetical protein
MVLVHDDDLSQLDGIHDWEDTVGRGLYCAAIVLTCSRFQTLESLQLDALLSHLRIAEPKIHNISFGPGELVILSRTLYFSRRRHPPKRCERNHFGSYPLNHF